MEYDGIHLGYVPADWKYAIEYYRRLNSFNWNGFKDFELVGIFNDQTNGLFMSKYDSKKTYASLTRNHESFKNEVINFMKKYRTEEGFIVNLLKTFAPDLISFNVQATALASKFPPSLLMQYGNISIAEQLGWNHHERDYNCIPFSFPFDVVQYPAANTDYGLKNKWKKMFGQFIIEEVFKKGKEDDFCRRLMPSGQADSLKEVFKFFIRGKLF